MIRSAEETRRAYRIQYVINQGGLRSGEENWSVIHEKLIEKMRFFTKVFGPLIKRIREKVEGLLFEYGTFPEKESVLGELNVVNNPTYVNVKGAATVTFVGGQTIDLTQLKGDIALSSTLIEQVGQLERVEVSGRRVVTVENLTSFHRFDWHTHDAFVVYLGGFHNRVRREWIRRIFSQNCAVEYHHFGDIDAGGFYILQHLRERTGVSFRPWQMDVVTL